MNTHPFIVEQINYLKMSNEVMFKLLNEVKREVNMLKKRVNSIIDESNEVSSITEVVSRLNIIENKLATSNTTTTSPIKLL